MKNTVALQEDAQEPMKLEPLLNAAEISSTCKNDTVPLTGTADRYAKNSAGEKCDKKCIGCNSSD